MTPTQHSLTLRLEAKSIPEPNSGCIIWLGRLNDRGYGKISIQIDTKTRDHFVHRVVYELVRGKIPEGMTLDHLCRVKCCVNPWHLEPVSNLENLRRAWGLPVAIDGYCLRGHPFDEINTYIRPARGERSCRICGRERTRVRRRIQL